MSSIRKTPRDPPGAMDEESQTDDSSEWLEDIAHERRVSIYAKHGIDMKDSVPDYKAQVDSRTIFQRQESLRRKSSIGTCQFVPGPGVIRSDESSVSDDSVTNSTGTTRPNFLRLPTLTANLVRSAESEYVFAVEAVERHCCTGKKSMMLCLSISIIIALASILAWVMTENFTVKENAEVVPDDIANNNTDGSEISFPTFQPTPLSLVDDGGDNIDDSSTLPNVFGRETNIPTESPTGSPIFFTTTALPSESTTVSPIENGNDTPTSSTQPMLRPTVPPTTKPSVSMISTPTIQTPTFNPSRAPSTGNLFTDIGFVDGESNNNNSDGDGVQNDGGDGNNDNNRNDGNGDGDRNNDNGGRDGGGDGNNNNGGRDDCGGGGDRNNDNDRRDGNGGGGNGRRIGGCKNRDDDNYRRDGNGGDGNKNDGGRDGGGNGNRNGGGDGKRNGGGGGDGNDRNGGGGDRDGGN